MDSPTKDASDEESSPFTKEPAAASAPTSPSALALVPSSRKMSSASSLHRNGETSLRLLLCDPISGDLMEDAALLPCGHSFGSGGIQRVIEDNVCVTCGLHIPDKSFTPNFALQAVVKAFRREERNRRALSRRRQRERFIQDHIAITDFSTSRSTRLRGPLFPFSVGDKVMIKGNKRTPDRFVNREATITAQCLNGWFMVKTLDNGEAVKLQHRSLIKA